MRKATGWQQTGFRADRELLNRFRSKLASEGKDMGRVLEEYIEFYVDNQRTERSARFRKTLVKRRGPAAKDDAIELVRYVLDHGGEAADLLKKTSFALAKMIQMQQVSVDPEKPKEAAGD